MKTIEFANSLKYPLLTKLTNQYLKSFILKAQNMVKTSETDPKMASLLTDLQQNKLYQEMCIWRIEAQEMQDIGIEYDASYARERVQSFLKNTFPCSMNKNLNSKIFLEKEACYNKMVEANDQAYSRQNISSFIHKIIDFEQDLEKMISLDQDSGLSRVMARCFQDLKIPSTNIFTLYSNKCKYHPYYKIKYSKSIKELRFSKRAIDTPVVSRDLEFLSRISCKVTKIVTLFQCKISQKYFANLLCAFRHVKCINLNGCKLLYSPKLSLENALKGCKIESISISGCSGIRTNNWEDHPERFYDLIDLFSTSEDLKKSLRCLQVHIKTIPKVVINCKLLENGFTNL
ncbi:unnamed protein product [Moneuplotes crassus]|uniref:Uncharacterized protein n=1 Tax=Euplotes crassus TaxID=5936 RepID=A0AAD1XK52_EUPCR|nr:unnamed protein product [Moneuplotes crassus]